MRLALACILIATIGMSVPIQEPTHNPIQLSDTRNPCGISDSDFEFFARVVQAEDCGDPNDHDNRVAVAQVIWNRVDSENWPDSVYEVLTESGQFSTVKNGDCSAVADDDCRMAIIEAYLERPHPENMVYFRADFFFSSHIDYKKISDNCFSLE